MKLSLIFSFLLLSYAGFCQDTIRVVRVNNATVRTLIEQFTELHTKPDAIKFININSSWVTSIENFQNARYIGIREDFKQFLIDNGINTNISSLKEALETYGNLILYVKPIGDL